MHIICQKIMSNKNMLYLPSFPFMYQLRNDILWFKWGEESTYIETWRMVKVNEYIIRKVILRDSFNFLFFSWKLYYAMKGISRDIKTLKNKIIIDMKPSIYHMEEQFLQKYVSFSHFCLDSYFEMWCYT